MPVKQTVNRHRDSDGCQRQCTSECVERPRHRCTTERQGGNRCRYRQKHESRQEYLQSPNHLLAKNDVVGCVKSGECRVNRDRTREEYASDDASPKDICPLRDTHCPTLSTSFR